MIDHDDPHESDKAAAAAAPSSPVTPKSDATSKSGDWMSFLGVVAGNPTVNAVQHGQLVDQQKSDEAEVGKA